MATLPAITVEVSHDNGDNWTDVTAYAKANDGGQIQFTRGRTSPNSDWEPGSLSAVFVNHEYAVDALNDDAVFQIRKGDMIRVAFAGGAYGFTGWVTKVKATYAPGSSSGPWSTLAVAAVDGLSKLAQARGAQVGGANDDPGQELNNAFGYSGIDYPFGFATDTGLTPVSKADYNPTNPPNTLEYFQKVTLTEGGNSRLYAQGDGDIQWKARDYKPSRVVAFGTGGIPITAIDIDDDVEVVNQLQISPGAHSESYTSSTSIATGVGRKGPFTVAGVDDWASPGAPVRIVSAGDGDTMTGTIHEVTPTTLTVDVHSVSGSGTNADWTITTTESPITAVQTTSSTSLSATTGEKTFTVAAGLAITPGALVGICSVSAAKAMTGTVKSYSATTLVCDITGATTSGGTSSDWSITTLASGSPIVSDDESHGQLGQWFTKSLSTLHATRSAALAEGRIRCAESAFPETRVTMIEAEIAAAGVDNTGMTNLVTLDMDCAASVVFDRGAASEPQHVTQTRMIDGVQVTRTAVSHRVRFYLGMVPTLEFTPTLKQSGTRTAVVDDATYKVTDGWCTGHFYLDTLQAGSAGNEITVETDLPAPASAEAGENVGMFWYFDSGTDVYQGRLSITTGSVLRFQDDDSGGAALGVTPSVATASADTLSGYFTYRHA